MEDLLNDIDISCLSSNEAFSRIIEMKRLLPFADIYYAYTVFHIPLESVYEPVQDSCTYTIDLTTRYR